MSSKIVFSIVLTSSLIIATIYTVSEKFNKDAFYRIELDEANIILKIIEPLIALDLYLGTNGNINSIGKDLIKNSNILSFKILKNNKLIYEIKSILRQIGKLFYNKKEIHKLNSDKTIGQVILKYSSKNYKQLRNKHGEFTIEISIILIFLLISLSLYIKKLLKPLRKISKCLT